MDLVTFVVDAPENLQQWGTIGRMLATHLPASSCFRTLHARIQPVRDDTPRSLSEWFHPFAYFLHAMLPVPKFPSDSVDTLYNVPMIPLNAEASRWKVSLDLSLQPDLACWEPAPQCLAASLMDVIGQHSNGDAAKREWILQLYEDGNIHVESGRCTMVSSDPIASHNGCTAQ